MTCLDIIREHLKSNGFDGLYNTDAGCACLLDELAPCDDTIAYCQPGYKRICTGEHCGEPCEVDCCDPDLGEDNWHIGPER